MEIRETILEDLKQLPALYKEHKGKDTNIVLMYENYQKMMGSGNYILLSAVEDDKLVGFLMAVINYDLVEQCNPFLTVWNVRVKNEYKRSGIGKSMMDYLDTIAAELNAGFIALIAENTNPEASKFYEAIGFYKHNGYVRGVGN